MVKKTNPSRRKKDVAAERHNVKGDHQGGKSVKGSIKKRSEHKTGEIRKLAVRKGGKINLRISKLGVEGGAVSTQGKTKLEPEYRPSVVDLR